MLTLANYLVELKGNTVPDIENVFTAYYKERSPTGRSMVEMSSRMGHLMNKKVIFLFFCAINVVSQGDTEAIIAAMMILTIYWYTPLTTMFGVVQ